MARWLSDYPECLQFCWDFVKLPRNDEIALQHFFFLACSSAIIFFYFICATCNFFLPTSACRNMSVTNVMNLLVFVLTNNYFKHDGHHYKQIFGCAMGSPISPVLADLVMEVMKRHPSPQLFILPNGGFVMLTTAIRA